MVLAWWPRHQECELVSTKLLHRGKMRKSANAALTVDVETLPLSAMLAAADDPWWHWWHWVVVIIWQICGSLSHFIRMAIMCFTTPRRWIPFIVPGRRGGSTRGGGGGGGAISLPLAIIIKHFISGAPKSAASWWVVEAFLEYKWVYFLASPIIFAMICPFVFSPSSLLVSVCVVVEANKYNEFICLSFGGCSPLNEGNIVLNCIVISY